MEMLVRTTLKPGRISFFSDFMVAHSGKMEEGCMSPLETIEDDLVLGKHNGYEYISRYNHANIFP
jgi:hypothetical protein